MCRITSVEPKPGQILVLSFDDGLKGEICIKDKLYGPMFEPLKNEEFFNLVAVDEFGAVYWPNDADLAPDVLHAQIAAGDLCG